MIRRLVIAVAGLCPAEALLRLERRLARPPFNRGLLRRLISYVLSSLRDEEVTIQRGLAAGLRFDAHHQAVTFVFGIHDLHAQRALAGLLREGMTFYDLGANCGFFTLIGARLVGPTGRVYAFEPIPELAAAIEHNVAANGMHNVVVRAQAVSDRSGPTDFLVFEEAGVMTGSHLASVAIESPGARKLTVEGVALDDFVHARAGPPPDVVKLDVEGAELDAVRGMLGIVRERRPAIIAELHGDQSELLALLAELGYVVRSLERPDRELLTPNPQVLALPAERAPTAPTAPTAAKGSVR